MKTTPRLGLRVGTALLLVGIMMGPLFGISAPSSISIENEFIKISVNNEDFDKGRLAIDTIKGDLLNPDDDNQPLIFGRPKPWTSYTTILVDGKPMIFGGPTQKRAGKTGLYGTVISQGLRKEGLVSVCQLGPLLVTQTLRLFPNPQSKLLDTALIEYSLRNTDLKPHKVGVRIMLDTLLGTNDGAPFRIGNAAVESEKLFPRGSFSPFWQTFDNLVSPNVVAEGTLLSPEDGISGPHRLYLANWGTLADSPWNSEVIPGRSFLRTGELEKDTALAIYWDPEVLQPAQSRTVRTLYGLGNLSLAPGSLALGLTAPSKIPETSKSDMTVVAYLQNTTTGEAKNTAIKLTIPKGFQVVNGPASYTFGALKPGASQQATFTLRPTFLQKGTTLIGFEASSTNLPANKLSRELEIVSAPGIGTSVSISKALGTPFYQDVTLTLTNPEGTPLTGLRTALSVAPPFFLPWFELPQKQVGPLLANEKKEIHWKIQSALPTRNLTARLTVNIASPVIVPKTLTRFIPIQTQPSQFKASHASRKVNDYFFVDYTWRSSPTESIHLSYDPSQVRWVTPLIHPNLIAKEIASTTNEKTFSLTTTANTPVWFKAFFQSLRPGDTAIRLHQESISENHDVHVRVE